MSIVYNMVAYKSKVMHVEDYTLNSSPIRHDSNAYPREYINGSDYSSRFLPDYRHLCETVIPENIYIISNNITESRYSVIPSPHNFGTKFSIWSGKTDIVTNINICKTTENINSTIIFEVTYHKGVIQLIIDIKFIVIMIDPDFPFQNISHSAGP